MSQTLKALCFVFLWVATVQAEPQLAQAPRYYYGENLDRAQDLKQELHRVLSAVHISKVDDFDRILPECPANQNDNCYSHKKLSYKKARQYLFGYLYLEEIGKSSYAIPAVYCDDQITDQQLPPKQSLGPMQIPYAQVLNAEHSWPQSKFSSKYPSSLQKSDLHALYPVRMQVNSTRGNHPFGEVVEVKSSPCEEAALGKNSKGDTVFEPAEPIKGNVARSLFYFSVRYNLPIEAEQERVLREWHEADPVDASELERHEETFSIQQDRNPFIDNPDWVKKVRDF